MMYIIGITFKDNKMIQFEAEKYYTDGQDGQNVTTYTFIAADKIRIISRECVKYITVDKTFN